MTPISAGRPSVDEPHRRVWINNPGRRRQIVAIRISLAGITARQVSPIKQWLHRSNSRATRITNDQRWLCKPKLNLTNQVAKSCLTGSLKFRLRLKTEASNTRLPRSQVSIRRQNCSQTILFRITIKTAVQSKDWESRARCLSYTTISRLIMVRTHMNGLTIDQSPQFQPNRVHLITQPANLSQMGQADLSIASITLIRWQDLILLAVMSTFADLLLRMMRTTSARLPQTSTRRLSTARLSERRKLCEWIAS